MMTNTRLISWSIQLLSHVQLFATPWTAACQTSQFITNSRSLLKSMSIESVMPSNHLILCRPLLFLPSIFPSIRVFSNGIQYIYKQLMQPNNNNKKKKTDKKWAEELNRHFSRRKYRWPTDTWNSTLLIIREMQTKTTLRYHPTPITMAIIKKNTNSKYWWGCGKRGILLHSWWECKWVQPLQKAIWRFLKRTTIWPSNSTPGCTLSKNEHTNLKRYMYPSAHSSIIYNCQDMEATQVSINRWMKLVRWNRFPRWC